MDTISIPAHFDGERILLDEPVALEPNTKLIVTVLSLPDSGERHNVSSPTPRGIRKDWFKD